MIITVERPTGRAVRIVYAKRTDCYCGGLEDPLPDGIDCPRCGGTFHFTNRLGLPDHCDCMSYADESEDDLTCTKCGAIPLMNEWTELEDGLCIDCAADLTPTERISHP
jgi:hypothetical protein